MGAQALATYRRFSIPLDQMAVVGIPMISVGDGAGIVVHQYDYGAYQLPVYDLAMPQIEFVHPCVPSRRRQFVLDNYVDLWSPFLTVYQPYVGPSSSGSVHPRSQEMFTQPSKCWTQTAITSWSGTTVRLPGSSSVSIAARDCLSLVSILCTTCSRPLI